MDIGPKLKKIRIARGHEHQKGFAANFGIDVVKLNKLETGYTKNPDIELIKALCDFYDTTVDAVVEWDGESIEELDEIRNKIAGAISETEKIGLDMARKGGLTREAMEHMSRLSKKDLTVIIQQMKFMLDSNDREEDP